MPASSTARKGSSAQKGKVPSQREEEPTQAAEHHGISLPSMPMPRIGIPGGTAGNVIWWGGLAAVAAFGVVDWPVVALVAAGTLVAEQHAKQAAARAKAAR